LCVMKSTSCIVIFSNRGTDWNIYELPCTGSIFIIDGWL
jgi:hypothetical protein